MTNEECFDAWAPPGGPWTNWAKPVLFTQLDRVPAATTESIPGVVLDLSSVPNADGRTALIVERAGADSVQTGLALASRGYRPVPLYNTSIGLASAVDVQPVANALKEGAEILKGISLPPDAPPAFLLDSRRTTATTKPTPGQFDNRWVVFPQDFPSAVYLRSHRVADVLIVADTDEPREDLTHVLRRWQQASIRILWASPPDLRQVHVIKVKAPSPFRRTWYRLLIAAGLYRNSAGGFGGIVPTPGSGG